MINNTREQLVEDVSEYLLRAFAANDPRQKLSWDEINTDDIIVKTYLQRAIQIWNLIDEMEEYE